MGEWEVEEKSGTLSSSGASPVGRILSTPDPSLTARDVQTGRAERLASSVAGNACVGALVLSAYVQQDQAMLLGRAGHGVARGVRADP